MEKIERFQDLGIGEVFIFESEHSHRSMAYGPWRKLSARMYEHTETPKKYGRIQVGSVNVEVVAQRRANPLSRIAVNDPPQRPKGTRKKPSQRLTARRTKTAKLPKGYYANPLTRVKVGSPSQRPSLVVVSEHGDPSPRLVKRRAKTKRGPAGAFANPAIRVAYDPIAADQMRIIVYAKMRDPYFKGKDKPVWREIARFDDLTLAKQYGQAFADQNNLQVKIGGNFQTLRSKK